jgi:predicted dehydrogenase
MILSMVEAEPVKIEAVGGYHLDPTIADVSTTHLGFAGGEQAHIFVSWLHPFKEQKLTVVGTEAMAVFDDGEPWDRKLQVYPHRVMWKDNVPVPTRAEVIPVAVHEAEPLREECLHFLDCIRTGARPRTDGREGVQVLKVLERASEALRAGAPRGLKTPRRALQ